MDPTSTGYPVMLAPGASSSSSSGPMRCPGLPRLDEGLLPEDSPYEILDGRRILTMANPEHAGPQAQLASVLRAAAAPGCYALVELTTRADTAPPPPGLDPEAELPPTVNELRSDACVLREGTDPRTGDRFVEDLSFEVVNEQSLADLKRKAARLTARGVRRVFALLVKRRQVLEWSAAQQEFVPVVGEIRDACLEVALPVRALLDAAVADDTVVRALDHKGNRALLQIRQESRHSGLDEGKRLGLDEGKRLGLDEGKRLGLDEGKRLGKAEDILMILRTRGFTLSEEMTGRILACQDTEQLTRWLLRSVSLTYIEDLFVQ